MLSKDERCWIEGHFDDLRKELVGVQVAIAKLQVKAGLTGLLGGLLPALGVALWFFLKG